MSHQVLRLPRETAMASTASTASNSPSESHQVLRLPRKTAAASTASSSTQRVTTCCACHTRQPRRQRRQAALQRVTKCCACHAKQPRRQRRQRHQTVSPRESPSAAPATRDSRGVNGVSGVKQPSRESPSAAPATQQSRGVNGIKLPPRESPSAAPATRDSRGVNGDRDKLIETS